MTVPKFYPNSIKFFLLLTCFQHAFRDDKFKRICMFYDEFRSFHLLFNMFCLDFHAFFINSTLIGLLLNCEKVEGEVGE